MAIARGDIFLAASSDKKMLSELNSTKIESGIYTCSESYTIGSLTSDKWTVICLSNETKENLHCYAQIWISVKTNSTLPRMFTRTSAQGQTTYSNFQSYINCPTDEVVDLYIGGTQPQGETGVTKIFLDID